jgi:hypothetical protein
LLGLSSSEGGGCIFILRNGMMPLTLLLLLSLMASPKDVSESVSFLFMDELAMHAARQDCLSILFFSFLCLPRIHV